MKGCKKSVNVRFHGRVKGTRREQESRKCQKSPIISTTGNRDEAISAARLDSPEDQIRMGHEISYTL